MRKLNLTGFLLLSILVLLIGGCSDSHSQKQVEGPANSSFKKLLAQYEGVSLYATNLENNYYTDLILEGHGRLRKLPWKTSTDPNKMPEIWQEGYTSAHTPPLAVVLYPPPQGKDDSRVSYWLDPATLATETNILASSKDDGFKLTADSLKYYYQGVKLTSKSTSCSVYFDIPRLPRGVMPELAVNDWDQDKKPEVAVFVPVGSGTGCSLYVAHIMNPDSGKEIPIDDPFKLWAGHSSNSLSKKHITVHINNHTMRYPMKKYCPPGAIMDIDKQFTSEVNEFAVNKNGEIICKIEASTHYTDNYVGTFTITYQYKDNAFVYKAIDFKPYEPEFWTHLW